MEADRGLEALEDIGDELAGKVSAQALHCGGIFLDERGEIACGLVLLTVSVVLVFVEDVAIAIIDSYGDDQGDEKAGGLLSGCVVSKRGGVLLEDGAVEDGIGIGAVDRDDAEACAGGEFAEHGVRWVAEPTV